MQCYRLNRSKADVTMPLETSAVLQPSVIIFFLNANKNFSSLVTFSNKFKKQVNKTQKYRGLITCFCIYCMYSFHSLLLLFYLEVVELALIFWAYRFLFALTCSFKLHSICCPSYYVYRKAM